MLTRTQHARTRTRTKPTRTRTRTRTRLARTRTRTRLTRTRTMTLTRTRTRTRTRLARTRTRTWLTTTRTRTRTSLTVTYCKLQLNLQSLSSNNNEHKVKVHNISAVCSDASLPTWHCASVPCWDASSDGWCGLTSPSPVCCDVDTGLAADTSIHPRRPRVSGGCFSRVEFSADIRHGYPVAPCVPPETEDDPVQRLFCQLNLAFVGLLVTFRL